VTRWLPLFVVLLLVLPIAVLVAIGGWTLWETGRLRWVWWLLPVCWGLAYPLARRWRARMLPPPISDAAAPQHWTPRDKEALEIIQQQQRAIKDISPEQLSDPHFYLETARQLALDIARHYHPRAKDPLGSLTVLEILAVTRLAAEELETWVERYLPGSHLLTVDQWRTIGKAPGWFRIAGNVSWVVAMMFNPLHVGRYLISKLTMSSASRQVQANVLAWFYVIFVRHVGYYVIEMNSGRLRGGAEQYRTAMKTLHPRADAPEGDIAPDETFVRASASEPVEVTVAVVGQVKAGKSSLVNALLGERRAATDVLPLTQGIEQYQLELSETRDRLNLLDTVGYGAEEQTKRQAEEIHNAVRKADLVLLVLRATSPARESDLQLLGEMSRWFAGETHRKPPPVLAVLTHIDGLSPMLVWSPPYDWQTGSSPKEQNIHGAVQHTSEQLAGRVAGVVPICSDPDRGRAYGAHEWLLPAMIALLDEARACALIRTLHEELDSGRVQKVFAQLFRAGSGFLSSYLR